MKRFYPVAIVAFVGLTILAIVLAGAPLGSYFSVASLLIVVLLPAVLLRATHSFAEIGAAFRAPRTGGENDLRVAIAFFGALGRYLLWSGFLATMIGVIALLSNLGDTSRIGYGAAIALLTVFYSIVLNLLVALPFRYAAEKKLAIVRSD